LETDEYHNAAFPTVFDVYGNYTNNTPDARGRLFDGIESDGGPLMDYAHYPSATGLPTNASDCGGKLSGMGAGYPTYAPYNGVGLNAPGVGLVYGGACAYTPWGQGNPIFEGQICTMGMPAGTYTLVLKALKDDSTNMGTNVLIPTDVMCTDFVDGPFAIKPDVVLEDSASPPKFVIVAAAVPILTVTPSNQNVAYTAGTTTFTVSSDITMNYTSSEAETWLSISAGGSGTCPPARPSRSALMRTPERLAWVRLRCRRQEPILRR
jgi:hypothetical protein